MTRSYRILFAAERGDSLISFAESLREEYDVLTASTKAGCERALQAEEIHLLVLDQSIAGKAGPKFLESVLTKHQSTIKILTGNKEDADFIIRAVNSGNVYRYIPKPWDESAMRRIIGHALQSFASDHEEHSQIVDLRMIIDELNFLHKISQQISEKKPLPVLLNEIMESSKLLMNAEASSLLLYDPEDGKLHFNVATGEKGRMIKKYSVNLGDGIAGWVAEHQQPLLITDCYADPRFNPEYDRKTHFQTRSMICVPLIRKNQLLGVIQVINPKGGGEFEERDLTIFKTLASQCAIAIENNRLIALQVESEAMERELDTAREIQQKLLPSKLPEYGDIQVAAKLIPAKQVGGDYYNVVRIDDQRSLLFVADVTGKGIPAALIVSTINSCLSSYLKFHPDRFDFMAFVAGMNRVLIESTTETKFATAWFGLYHHDRKILYSINAGHNPPFVFRPGEAEPLSLNEGGLFLGGLDMPYQKEEVQFGKDDVLVFFSDGVTEAWNEKEEDYEEHRLIGCVSGALRRTAEEILGCIEADVNKHVGRAPQSDDFTCAVVKIL